MQQRLYLWLCSLLSRTLPARPTAAGKDGNKSLGLNIERIQ